MNQILTHLSLFSGIGGIDLAAEWAGFTTVGQCELADYPTKVLEKHWPDVPRWRDIRDVNAKSLESKTGLSNVTLISGGFPCQPHSIAGKHKSNDDERDLWPELRYTLSEIKPKWFLGENVLGLFSSGNRRFFGNVLNDLAAMGYSIGWCTYGACTVGAIHQRKRIFIIAYSNSQRWHNMDKNFEIKLSDEYIAMCKTWRSDSLHLLPYMEWDFTNPISGIHRNDNGISEGVDRIKALGNAVVPQQVYPVLKAIAEIENYCNAEVQHEP